MSLGGIFDVDEKKIELAQIQATLAEEATWADLDLSSSSIKIKQF